MGLDMFIFQVTPPTHDPNVVYGYKELAKKGYELVEEQFMDDPLFASLKEYAVPFTVEEPTYNFQKLQADLRMESTPFVRYIEGSDAYFIYGKNTAIKTLSKSKMQKYITVTEKTVWAFLAKEVAYWRKDYEMCDIIHRAFLEDGISVANGGYHKLSTNQISAIQNAPNQKKINLWQYPDDNLFYFESF